jgi:tRNA-dihydrouridine synthase 3
MISHSARSSHFGTDTAGVNTTRRYLCEAVRGLIFRSIASAERTLQLSFQHRYVPIGLLEVLPGRINDRPPRFRGRDELGKFVIVATVLGADKYLPRNVAG